MTFESAGRVFSHPADAPIKRLIPVKKQPKKFRLCAPKTADRRTL
jgi:hypothetical protein